MLLYSRMRWLQVDDVDKRRTWGDCWRCDYRVFDCADISAKEADAFGGCKDDPGPHTKIKFVPMTMMGVYAPQIAWWLSFFPPENFVILTSEELHDPDRVAPVRFACMCSVHCSAFFHAPVVYDDVHACLQEDNIVAGALCVWIGKV